MRPPRWWLRAVLLRRSAKPDAAAFSALLIGALACVPSVGGGDDGEPCMACGERGADRLLHLHFHRTAPAACACRAVWLPAAEGGVAEAGLAGEYAEAAAGSWERLAMLLGGPGAGLRRKWQVRRIRVAWGGRVPREALAYLWMEEWGAASVAWVEGARREREKQEAVERARAVGGGGEEGVPSWRILWMKRREGAGAPHPGGAGPAVPHPGVVATPPREAGPRWRAKGGCARHGDRAPNSIFTPVNLQSRPPVGLGTGRYRRRSRRASSGARTRPSYALVRRRHRGVHSDPGPARPREAPGRSQARAGAPLSSASNLGRHRTSAQPPARASLPSSPNPAGPWPRSAPKLAWQT